MTTPADDRAAVVDTTTRMAWLADRLQEFTDTHPEFESAVERLATWLAREGDPED